MTAEHGRITKRVAGILDMKTWRVWHVPCAAAKFTQRTPDLETFRVWESYMRCAGCGQTSYRPVMRDPRSWWQRVRSVVSKIRIGRLE